MKDNKFTESIYRGLSLSASRLFVETGCSGGILAQQDLTQARSDYFTALAEYNKAQYALNMAVGGAQAKPGD